MRTAIAIGIEGALIIALALAFMAFVGCDLNNHLFNP